MTIRNRKLLAIFGFKAGAVASVEQPLSVWLRCLWWRWCR